MFPISGLSAYSTYSTLTRKSLPLSIVAKLENRKHFAEAETWSKRAGKTKDVPASIRELRRKFKDSAKDEVWEGGGRGGWDVSSYGPGEV